MLDMLCYVGGAVAPFGDLLQGNLHIGHKLQPVVFHLLTGHIRTACMNFTSRYCHLHSNDCYWLITLSTSYIIVMQDEKRWDI